jgi:CDP-glucose 4,6-dehydratase|tara:strand:- start:296 stop:1369 length:1074 start_codon:yes stop_codon:yes gene_type:complete
VSFTNNFKNKVVLVTGNTGFKGSWLSLWLNLMGAKVIGVSKDIPTIPSHYKLNNKFYMKNEKFDLSNKKLITKIIKNSKPDYIFHLAAQAIVLESYSDPYATYQSNTVGTLNILESLKESNHKCTAILITSDKCYENINKKVNYKENDRLGGLDPYSSSKASAELIIRSYYESYFKTKASNVRICSARAGNVMGGGDWAKYRIVPDCMKSWSEGKKVIIRNATSTRPWQHVLEPISGYLTLAKSLSKDKNLNGESFNFGPNSNSSHTVKELVDNLSLYYPGSESKVISDKNKRYEANLLSLNCLKAKKLLNWSSRINFKNTAKMTSQWYETYYNSSPKNAYKLSIEQIEQYIALLNR